MMSDHLFEQSHEEHAAAQLKRMAKETTPAQRIAWLEDALRLAHALGIDYLQMRRNEREAEPNGADPN